MPIRSLRYDSETGQAYSQWSEEPIRRSQTDWYREQPLQPTRGQSGRGVKGPRSLVDICVEVIAQHLSTCEVEDFDNVPPHLTYRICEYMDKVHFSISLQSFKIFANHLSQDQWESVRLRQMPAMFFKSRYTVERLAGPLSLYTNPLISASFDFIVRLTLAGKDLSVSTHDLLGLTKLKNLGVLEIVHPGPSEEAPNFPRVNDAVIREWAREPGSFPVLRVLRIWGEDFTTNKSIQYLSSFPSLAIYDVAGRKSDWSSQNSRDQSGEAFGWSSYGGNSPAGVLLSLSDNCVYFSPETAYSCIEAIKLASLESELAAFEEPPSRKRRRGAKSAGRDDSMSPSISADMLYMIQSTATRTRPMDYDNTQSWGYLLYCFIGQLRSDGDLTAQGVKDTRATLNLDNREVIPQQPFISVNLGPSPAKNTDRRVYEKHCTFARMEYNTTSYEHQSGAEEHITLTKMLKKRKVYTWSMFDNP
ncbi:hypothetical protein F5Y06DRAFT_111174 [Hypoxylon sp. FL0890]|nr:hypothetical protein F5Y06DRAFT_111174 [Hypoxylon sp. FL0890]